MLLVFDPILGYFDLNTQITYFMLTFLFKQKNNIFKYVAFSCSIIFTKMNIIMINITKFSFSQIHYCG